MLRSERKSQPQDPGSKNRTWGTLRVTLVCDGGKICSPIDTRFWMTSLSSGAPGMLKSERKGQTQDPGSKTRTWGTLRVMVVGEEQKTFSSDLHSCLR
jgi:hypothetical protein